MGHPTKNGVILYRATNANNGKVYIGVTQRPISDRRREHINEALSGRGKHPFSLAIRKYGSDAFSWEVVQTFMFADDAMNAEIQAIKTIGRHRTYNFLEGGKGGGGELSADARARISAFHKGKKWGLGKKRSDETRALLRKIGLRGRKAWLKRSYLGPAALAKRVVCLDDGKSYASASDAGRVYGIPKSQIIEVCNRVSHRIAAKDLIFRYEGDHLGGIEEANAERAKRYENRIRNSKALRKCVRCIDDGLVFVSAKEASSHYGVHRSHIGEVCRGERAHARGLHFEYVRSVADAVAVSRKSGSRSAAA